MSYINQRKMRPLFAHAVKCELDAQGRALIPQALRDYAGLVKMLLLLVVIIMLKSGMVTHGQKSTVLKHLRKI